MTMVMYPETKTINLITKIMNLITGGQLTR